LMDLVVQLAHVAAFQGRMAFRERRAVWATGSVTSTKWALCCIIRSI